MVPFSTHVTASPVFVTVGNFPEMAVVNNGSSTVYYGHESVSSTSYVGSIAAGVLAHIATGYWFACAPGEHSCVQAIETFVQSLVASSASEVNVLHGVTADTADLNTLTDFTGTPVASKQVTFAEAVQGVASTYTGNLAVPADATILEISVVAAARWNDSVSAVLNVGDDADPDGFFAGVNLKAGGDLEAGDSLTITRAGGKGGVYTTADSSTAVTARYSNVARTLSGVITCGAGNGFRGRTRLSVFYSLPTATYTTTATVAAT